MGDVGQTITGGIQDISALLPLLGTEQCETHVGSALSEGYLYAAAAPMSIFGSLGLVKAGIKAVLAAVSIQRFKILGARKVEHAGFTPSGKSLGLIMMDPEGTGIHLAESKFDKLCKEYHIEYAAERLQIKSTWSKWNIRLLVTTAFLCACGITPYIHLTKGGPGSRPSLVLRWLFPAVRVFGGFLISYAMQILIQHRILRILGCRLAFHRLDALVKTAIPDAPESLHWHAGTPAEECLWNLHVYMQERKRMESSPKPPPVAFSRLLDWIRVFAQSASTPCTQDGKTEMHRDIEKGINDGNDARMRLKTQLKDEDIIGGTDPLHLILVVVGICCSLVGYVGCFSVVQGARNSRDPVIWLVLEAVLSVLRIVIWSWNPSFDDCDPIKILFKTDTEHPHIPCYHSDATIKQDGCFNLPIVDARQFFTSVINSVGLLDRFDSPNVILYYTLARRIPDWPGLVSLKDRVLYITIFDRQRQTCRVFFAGDDEIPHIFSAEPFPNPSRVGDPTTVQITGRIDPNTDAITSDPMVLSSIQRHHRSLVHRIRSRDESAIYHDIIEFSWILNARRSMIIMPTAPVSSSPRIESLANKNSQPATDTQMLVNLNPVGLHAPITKDPFQQNDRDSPSQPPRAISARDASLNSTSCARLRAAVYIAFQTEMVLIEEMVAFATNPAPWHTEEATWSRRLRKDIDDEVAFTWSNVNRSRNQFLETARQLGLQDDITNTTTTTSPSLEFQKVLDWQERVARDLNSFWNMALEYSNETCQDLLTNFLDIRSGVMRWHGEEFLTFDRPALETAQATFPHHYQISTHRQVRLQRLNMRLRVAQRDEQAATVYWQSSACSRSLGQQSSFLFIHLPVAEDPYYVDAVRDVLFGDKDGTYEEVDHVVFCQHGGWGDGDGDCAAIIDCLERFPSLEVVEFECHGIGEESYKATERLARKARECGRSLEVVGIKCR